MIYYYYYSTMYINKKTQVNIDDVFAVLYVLLYRAQCEKCPRAGLATRTELKMLKSLINSSVDSLSWNLMMSEEYFLAEDRSRHDILRCKKSKHLMSKQLAKFWTAYSSIYSSIYCVFNMFLYLFRTGTLELTLNNNLNANNLVGTPGFVFSLYYIVGFGLVEMVISTISKPTICRNLYENTGTGVQKGAVFRKITCELAFILKSVFMVLSVYSII